MSLHEVLAHPGLDLHLLGCTSPVAFHRLRAASISHSLLEVPYKEWLASQPSSADGDTLQINDRPGKLQSVAGIPDAEAAILILLKATEASSLVSDLETVLDKLYILTLSGRPKYTFGSDKMPVHNPLDLAVLRSLRPLIPVLRMRGYELELLDAYSVEALVQDDDVEAVAAYLEAGISVDIRGNAGRSLLMIAVAFRAQNVAPLLLRWNADVHQRSGFGSWTALMWAAHVGWEPGCRLLLNAGADSTAQNGQGQTALDIAARQRKEGVVELLSNLEKNGISQ